MVASRAALLSSMASMAEPRKTPDWELAERLYRAGQLTLRQIAEQVGCTNAAVLKKARLKGWERNLSGRVRETVKARVSKGQVSKVSKTEKSPVDDDEIVEGQVAATLLVINSHDTRRGKIKAQIDKRLNELDAMSGDDAVLPAIDGLKKLTETALKVELAEREALGLGEGTECHEDRLKRLLGGG